MKKETIIAIFFGILFGSLVAVVLLTKNKEFQLTKTKTIVETNSVGNQNKTSVPLAKTLEIMEPQDNFVTDKDVLTIKGKADKDALIIVQSPTKDVVIKNEKEQFSVNLPLSLGENIIDVTLYSKGTQTRIQEKELHVYYLSEQL